MLGKNIFFEVFDFLHDKKYCLGIHYLCTLLINFATWTLNDFLGFLVLRLCYDFCVLIFEFSNLKNF